MFYVNQLPASLTDQDVDHLIESSTVHISKHVFILVIPPVPLVSPLFLGKNLRLLFLVFVVEIINSSIVDLYSALSYLHNILRDMLRRKTERENGKAAGVEYMKFSKYLK